MKRIDFGRKAALAFATTFLIAGGSAHAQAIPDVPGGNIFQKIEAQSNKDMPPVLDFLVSNGVSLTYLGDAGGLDGYLGETSTGKIQTFYVAPDGKHLISGVLFRQGGINLTGIQLNDMQNRYDAARKLAAQAKEVTGSSAEDVQQDSAIKPGLVEVPPEAIQLGEAARPSADEYKSNRKSKFFKQELENTPWFGLGAEDAPVLYMVADPNCPFCHETWKQLRPKVMSQEVNLRIILIAGLNGSEAKAISILSRERPGRAWMNGEGSTSQAPVAPPPAASSSAFKNAKGYLTSNTNFADTHEIMSTPHLIYYDADDTLFESRGMPADLETFLGGMSK